MGTRILVVDDEVAVVKALQSILSREGYEVVTSANGQEALDRLEEGEIDLIIADLKMEPIDGLELIARAKELYPNVVAIMITGYASVETATRAMKEGAFDYVVKPFKIDEILVAVERALTYESVLTENHHLREALSVKCHFQHLVGEAPRMRQVYDLIKEVGVSDSNVLLLGESGTGKSIAGRVLHYASKRMNEPLVELSCLLLAEDELEARLFGGPGATQPSAFREGHGGAILLDDIGSLPLTLQHRLHHSLKNGETFRDSNREAVTADVRLIATSTLPLEDRIRDGRFVEGLYHQLNAVTIELPPLRERVGDMPVLVRHLLNRYSESQERFVSLDGEALAALEAYQWPGNVVQLEQVIRECADACQSGAIAAVDLPQDIQAAAVQARAEGKVTAEFRWRSLKQFLREKEHSYVAEIVRRTQGDRAAAAQQLGVTVEEFNAKYSHLLD